MATMPTFEKMTEIVERVQRVVPIPMRMLFTMVVLPTLRFLEIALADYLHIILPTWFMVQVATLVLLVYLRSVILKANRQGDVTVVGTQAAMSQSWDVLDVFTVVEYDLSKLQSMLNQTGMTSVMAIAVFSYSGYPQVFLLQSIFSPQQLWASPLFQIYVLGRRSIKGGSLGRPFKGDTMPNFYNQMQKHIADGERKVSTKRGKKGK